jgi:hypothetical protein
LCRKQPFELPTCESWDMALTKSEARERALSYLRSLGPRDDYELVLLDDYTLEKPSGGCFSTTQNATSKPGIFEMQSRCEQFGGERLPSDARR